MPENLTPIRSLLAEAIDHLLACGVPVLITGDSSALRYKIMGEVVSEGEIIARALAKGMAGHSEIREPQ
jgi:hypothetical protein